MGLDRIGATLLLGAPGAGEPLAAQGAGAFLEPGTLADLAVLTADYMIVPEDGIGSIESLLTMVGGRIVYAAGPYAELEQPSTP